ncbi:Lysine-specific demethylase 4B [Drechmeria coniospora]|uniref:Lysine-specific demethylase 4B n=1 Tax=Drechmeria coniospora TaxID=98403 RepID=A0A151GBZ1_DRECN|nr:Lysine-specific demethylase 4B [Drechmeria coniospora]KYK54628.1 Lysine-specific demethylase 4B [Drechmeria coniospora]ODA76149.1 hypothetical protein RJ55_08432 [Drechmeria coniospora]
METPYHGDGGNMVGGDRFPIGSDEANMIRHIPLPIDDSSLQADQASIPMALEQKIESWSTSERDITPDAPTYTLSPPRPLLHRHQSEPVRASAVSPEPESSSYAASERITAELPDVPPPPRSEAFVGPEDARPTAEPLEPAAVEPASVEPPTAGPPVAEFNPAAEPLLVETLAIEPASVEPPAADPPAADPPAADPPAADPPAAPPFAAGLPPAEFLAAGPPAAEPLPVAEFPAAGTLTVDPPAAEFLVAGPSAVDPPAAEFLIAGPPTVDPPTVDPPAAEPRATSSLLKAPTSLGHSTGGRFQGKDVTLTQTLLPDRGPLMPAIDEGERVFKDLQAESRSREHIDHDYDDVHGHRILRLKPTKAQWQNFTTVLAYARELGADRDGCFKVSIPECLRDELPRKAVVKEAANAYRIKQIRKTTFWQVSTVPSNGQFCSSNPDPDFSTSVDAAIKQLRKIFRASKDRQMRSVRYRVDVPAWTAEQRRAAGIPERSPIHPLKGDKLDWTKAIIPGIHTPYVYESGSHFGATFQIHAEDFRLASLNHLYKGRKIWIVVPATAVDVAEKALGRGQGCSQFMRHRAEFVFPDKLDKLGIPYRLVDQRPGETVVILPDAYHEGFSTGYTIAEAKNYADANWDAHSYQPCDERCKLVTAIPEALMRLVGEGEERLDLCRAYGTGIEAVVVPEPAVANKRPRDEPGDGRDGAVPSSEFGACGEEWGTKRMKRMDECYPV